jgi:hypothetical protein
MKEWVWAVTLMTCRPMKFWSSDENNAETHLTKKWDLFSGYVIYIIYTLYTYYIYIHITYIYTHIFFFEMHMYSDSNLYQAVLKESKNPILPMSLWGFWGLFLTYLVCLFCNFFPHQCKWLGKGKRGTQSETILSLCPEWTSFDYQNTAHENKPIKPEYIPILSMKDLRVVTDISGFTTKWYQKPGVSG